MRPGILNIVPRVGPDLSHSLNGMPSFALLPPGKAAKCTENHENIFLQRRYNKHESRTLQKFTGTNMAALSVSMLPGTACHGGAIHTEDRIRRKRNGTIMQVLPQPACFFCGLMTEFQHQQPCSIPTRLFRIIPKRNSRPAPKNRRKSKKHGIPL